MIENKLENRVWTTVLVAVTGMVIGATAHADLTLLMRDLTGGTDGNPGSTTEAVTNFGIDDLLITLDGGTQHVARVLLGPLQPFPPTGFRATATIDVTGDGSLQVTFASGQNVTDGIGNALETIGASADAVIDLTPPVLSFIQAHTVGPTSLGDFSFSFVFDEEISSLKPSHMAIHHAGTTNSSLSVANLGAGSSFLVSVGGVSGNGSFSVSVGSPGLVQDLAGNSLVSVAVFHVDALAYAAWAATNGLTFGVNDDPEDDPDNDGKANIIEFALDDDPFAAAFSGKLREAIADLGRGDHMTLTFPIREAASFKGSDVAVVDGVYYTVDGAEDLPLGRYDPVDTLQERVALSSGMPTLSPGWVYITFSYRETTDLEPIAFIRLRVGPDNEAPRPK